MIKGVRRSHNKAFRKRKRTPQKPALLRSLRKSLTKNRDVEQRLNKNLVFSSANEKEEQLKKRKEFELAVRDSSIKAIKEGFEIKGVFPFVVFTDLGNSKK